MSICTEPFLRRIVRGVLAGLLATLAAGPASSAELRGTGDLGVVIERLASCCSRMRFWLSWLMVLIRLATSLTCSMD